ncbi:MAG: hypothetical protein KBS52_05235 [Clostridiales bacterium]|nr:hypothetical protein [Candidatus Equinaster intestinalis]
MQTEHSAKATKVKPEIIRIFALLDSEELFLKIEQFYTDPRFRNIRSDLYKLGGIYLLVLHLKNAQKSTVRGFTDQTHYFYILEHGKKLCENNAISRIGKILTESS